MAEKMSMDDKQIIGITKLKLQAFSLAALETILGDIVVKVSSVMERTSIQFRLLHIHQDISKERISFIEIR